jgi:hypothetical protein
MPHTQTPHANPHTSWPAYNALEQCSTFEVREYAPYLVAEVTVPGSAITAGTDGFSTLVRYIFGGNDTGTRLPMLAPVTLRPVAAVTGTPIAWASPADGAYAVQFVMPRGHSVASLPVPDDARVKLNLVPSHRLAVFRYPGRWTPENYAQHLKALRTALRQAGIAIEGEPMLARYEAPYVPPVQRGNEIWMPIGDT